MKWLLLFLGGGIGASLRFALATFVDERAPETFPWGTFAVNAAGCFAIGLLATFSDEHHWLSPGARLFLVAGLLGGFTTFSTYGFETWQLIEDGAAAGALAYAVGSVAVGLVAVVFGALIARQLG
ncbi:MAG: fluoride efflux transporter CrcB [Myxococcota bacterium]